MKGPCILLLKVFALKSDKIFIWMGKIVIKMDDGFLSRGD